ncbi:hypothetical protein A6302_02327 [Methylobrevis pamukkalensis]|uniref:Uncharacterized protein n=1 Tax=Methylobrevis pamukkalensis TaxID=1439726 RepID=A0A1E3H1Y6_9HYPH|nr:hypothetical protein A6302_02327 [Methylobrevis pamukkalensis]
MFDRVAVRAQHRHQLAEPGKGVVEGAEFGDLRADVHVDADDPDARQRRGPGIDPARLAPGNAELVLRLAGRDLGVGEGIDVGIDPEATAATSPRAAAIADSASSSGSDSTLKQWMPASSASAISPAVLPTPEKAMRLAGTPAASARFSSPPETTSMPAPSRASVLSTA